MHCATFSSLASVCAVGWVWVPGSGGPLPASSFEHFTCASLNAGDERSTPFALNRKPPPGEGSGKLGTPLARMHLENASAVWLVFAGASGGEVVAPPPVVVLVSVRAAPPAAATVETLSELPPQPAIRIPLTRSASGSGARISRIGWTCCIGSPSWRLRMSTAVLRRGWFPPGFPPRVPVTVRRGGG